MTVLARTGEPEASPLVRVRVWDLPVRVIHWLLVLALVVLSVTGYLIATPILVLPEEYDWVTVVKVVHKSTAYAFIALIGARVAWMFLAPNRWSRWTEWIPTTRERIGQIIPSLRFYLFLSREAPPVVGHNPLAGMTYTVLYLMFGIEIVTGLALWGVEGVAGRRFSPAGCGGGSGCPPSASSTT